MTRTKTFTVESRNVLVQTTAFTDKIFINIFCQGKLGRTFAVALRGSPSSGGFDPSTTVSRGVGNLSDADYLKSQHYFEEDSLADHDYSLLPLNHLTAQPLLGGGMDSDSDIFARLVAVQIATLVASHNPAETRTLVVSLGPLFFSSCESGKGDNPSDALWDVLSAIGQCRVW
ncbi:hypothetical protein NADFUDRAFT_53803 [Nadsonia fulvescens var. elongata DSM 6958]|uniref:Proteasome assembly chaperone 3 n=1 Tax=Nadsonia fulvescens var. elongata DSM 6958 TaxID=857566 RepID=A0A1E3PCL4_9ASCO|nr:hypothetical protein NADFUDRAFT_53803 [Nadsonia fulvescens var. elongata DSM 6958]